MRRLRVVRSEGAATSTLASILFSRLWDALAELLGTAATAALLTRAARRAQARSPELRALTILRVDRDYIYVVPPSFHREMGPPLALLELAGELRPLLAESTGQVAQRHLAKVPELRSWMATAC